MFLVLTLLAYSIGASIWRLGEPSRAIERLPASERQELYEQTKSEMQRLCRAPIADGFIERCRAQGAFLILFPECDVGCRDLIRQSWDQRAR
jgi:hypothetical protein